MNAHPTNDEWQRQEDALRQPEATALRRVLASPPPLALPHDFAARVAALAAQRALRPSPWIERGLAIAAVVMLSLGVLVARHWQPALWSWLPEATQGSGGGGWWPLVALALLLSLGLQSRGRWTGRAAPGRTTT